MNKHTIYLTTEQQLDLAKNMTQENKLKLYHSILPYILKMCLKYYIPARSLLDYWQYCAEYFFKVIDKFNPEKNNSLLTYMAWWIKSAVQCAHSGNNRREFRNSVAYQKDWEFLSTDQKIRNDSSSNYDGDMHLVDLFYTTDFQFPNDKLDVIKPYIERLSSRQKQAVTDFLAGKGTCSNLTAATNSLKRMINKENKRRIFQKELE